MHDLLQWPLALLDGIQITPQIAYRGPAPDWASDHTYTLPFFTWWEICGGLAEVTTPHGSVVAGPGEWILIPHGIARHQRLEKGTRLTSLSFRAVWPSGRPVMELREPITGSARAGWVKLARAACGILKNTGGSAAAPVPERVLPLPDWLKLRSLLMSFVGELVKEAQSRGGVICGPFFGDQRLDLIVGELRRKLRAGPLPYDGWQRRLGIGRAQIDRLARQHLGCSLRASRDALLTEEVRCELCLATLSAKELAAKYGFVDAAHFSRWVRQMTGHSPRELRRGAI